MLHWIPYTFLRVVLFFIGGILLGIYLPDGIPETTAIVLFLFFLTGYVAIVIFNRIRKAQVINPGFVGAIFIFLGGYLTLLIQTDTRQLNHLIHVKEEATHYRVRISSYAQEKDRSWKQEAEVTELRYDNSWHRHEGKVLLYFSKDFFQQPFAYGDVLLIKGSPQVLRLPENPGEFDYKRFLSFRNIYHQQFIREGEVKWIENNPSSFFMSYAIQTRLWADDVFKKYVSGEEEQGIAVALILGITDDLDNGLLRAYSATGAMHVLSVSGLHVGILYMVIIFLLRPVKKMHHGKWIIAIISLFILWAYAFVTGLSPSVLRAVTMFTFVALARPLNQRTNIYNTLSASAFCLLIFDPYLIMSVGFQLSYLAVLGIVYLQPVFYAWWEPQSKFWDEVWKVTCVSIAAQIATFSLGLLYFHQFPNYFLISNLLVIPISFGVLVVGLAVLAVSMLQPVAALLGFILEWLIKAMNFVVYTVEDFPLSLLNNIYITTTQCWILMLMIVFAVLLFEKRKLYYTVALFVLTCWFTWLQWNHFKSDVDISKLTVYKISGHTAIDFIDHGQIHFISDSLLATDAERLRFHIQPNRLISGVQQFNPVTSFVRETKFGRVIVWNNKVILIRDDKNLSEPVAMKVDYLILSNNSVKDLPSLLGKVEATHVILDSSNSFYYADRMLKQNATHQGIYSVWHQGAFESMI